MKYKVGDLIEVVYCDGVGDMFYKVGNRGVITEVYDTPPFPYRVYIDGTDSTALFEEKEIGLRG